MMRRTPDSFHHTVTPIIPARCVFVWKSLSAAGTLRSSDADGIFGAAVVAASQGRRAAHVAAPLQARVEGGRHGRGRGHAGDAAGDEEVRRLHFDSIVMW